MGTYTLAYLDHSLDLSQLKKLDEFLSTDENQWSFELEPTEEKYLAIGQTTLFSPGQPMLCIYLEAIMVYTSWRWRGFLSMLEIREIL